MQKNLTEAIELFVAVVYFFLGEFKEWLWHLVRVLFSPADKLINAFWNISFIRKVRCQKEREKLEAYLKEELGESEEEFVISSEHELKRYNGTAEHVIVPDGVKRIGKYAFACRNVKSVVFPESVESISYSIFCFCENLEYVTLPESLREISEDALHIYNKNFEMTCRGIRLPIGKLFDELHVFPKDVITMVQFHEYQFVEEFFINTPAVHFVEYLFSRALEHPEETALRAYLNENFDEILKKFREYLQAGEKCKSFRPEYYEKTFNPRMETELIEKLLASGTFFTEASIADAIRLTNEQENYELQLELMDYKASHFSGGIEGITQRLSL
ncbi:MAG: leucine-rich repeat domain-containing protein [Oscillospiraceae bacterium]|nr:leucine-rich repeat domain-containing protein [Oscillospiraceae bacterium]